MNVCLAEFTVGLDYLSDQISQISTNRIAQIWQIGLNTFILGPHPNFSSYYVATSLHSSNLTQRIWTNTKKLDRGFFNPIQQLRSTELVIKDKSYLTRSLLVLRV